MKIIQNFRVFKKLEKEIDKKFHRYIKSPLNVIYMNYGEMEGGDEPTIPKGDGGVVILIERIEDFQLFKEKTGIDLLSEDTIFEGVQEFKDCIDMVLLAHNEFGYEIIVDKSLKDELLKNSSIKESYVVDENLKGNFKEYSEGGKLIEYTTEEWYAYQENVFDELIKRM